MGRRRCCCNECLTYSDDFNRSSLGTGWTVEGVASIESDTLKIESGSAIFNTNLPDPLGSFVVTFDVVNPQDGDVFDFIAVDDDGDILLIARFRADATNGVWQISLRAAGYDAVADNEDLLGCGTYQLEYLSGRTFVISYDRSTFRVGGESPESPHYDFAICVNPLGTGSGSWAGENVRKVGFSHGGGPRDIYFDNFFLSDHGVHNARCPAYGCRCTVTNSICLADTLYLTLENPSSCYPQLPASSVIELRRLYRSQSYWVSDKVLPAYGCTTETWFYIQFFFWCTYTPNGQSLHLGWSTQCDDSPLCNLCTGAEYRGEWRSLAENCDPLSLQFEYGPWNDVWSKEPDDCDFGYPECPDLVAWVTE